MLLNIIVCMIACALFGAVCAWAVLEYRDSLGVMVCIIVYELICLAATLFLFFPR